MTQLSRNVIDPRMVVVESIVLPKHWTPEFKTFVLANLTAVQAVKLMETEQELLSLKQTLFHTEQQMIAQLQSATPDRLDQLVYPEKLYRMEQRNVGTASQMNVFDDPEILDLSIYRLDAEAEEYPKMPEHWTLLFCQYCIDVLSPEGVDDLIKLETNVRESNNTFGNMLNPQELDDHVGGLMDELFTKSGVESFPLKFVREGGDVFEIETKPVSTATETDAMNPTPNNQQVLPTHWAPEFQQFVREKFTTGETRLLIRFEQELIRDNPTIGRHAIARKLRHEVQEGMRSDHARFSKEEIDGVTWNIIDTNPDTPLDLNVDTSVATKEPDMQNQHDEVTPVFREAFDFAAPNAPVLSEAPATVVPVEEAVEWPKHWSDEFRLFLLGEKINYQQSDELIGYEHALRAGDVMFEDFDPLTQTLGEPRIVRELLNRVVEMFAIEDPSALLDVYPFKDGVPYAEDMLVAHSEATISPDNSENDMPESLPTTNASTVETTAGTAVDEFPVSDAVTFQTATIADMDAFWSPAFIYSIAHCYEPSLLPAIKASWLTHLDHGRRDFPGDEAMAKAYAEMNALRSVELDRQLALRVPADANLSVKVETMDELVDSPVADANSQIDKTVQATTKLDSYHPEIEEGPLPELDGKFPLRVQRQSIVGGPVFSNVFLYATSEGRDIAWAAVQQEQQREAESVLGTPMADIPRSHASYDPSQTGHGGRKPSAEDLRDPSQKLPPPPLMAVREHAAKHPTAESIPADSPAIRDMEFGARISGRAAPQDKVSQRDSRSTEARLERLEQAVFAGGTPGWMRDPAERHDTGTSFGAQFRRGQGTDFGARGYGGRPYWGPSQETLAKEHERRLVEELESQLRTAEEVFAGDRAPMWGLSRKQYGQQIGHTALSLAQQLGVGRASLFGSNPYHERATIAYTRLSELANRLFAGG